VESSNNPRITLTFPSNSLLVISGEGES